jgi:NADPH-dependent 2,4-dienoyl-CoA reductase/sulfur reductase-like enzyme
LAKEYQVKNNNNNMHIVILGNGIAGIAAARTIRQLSDHRITVISGESKHFFSRTALMYIYMGHMRFEDTKPYEDWFWGKNRIELMQAYVDKVEPQAKRLVFDDGSTLTYDRLLIACGSRSNKFGWPGQDLDGVQGLYSLQDLEAMEHYSEGLKRAVIVGGGLIGIEMAEMLHSRHIPVTFLVREKNFWDIVLPVEEAKMIDRHIAEQGIDLRLETELKEIWGDQYKRAKAVVTNKGEKIECGFVGLTVGVSPNVDFLHFSGIDLGKGVLVNDYLETNIPGIFAAGDCAQLRNPKPGRRPIEAVWYVGRMMGEVAAHNIVASANAESGMRNTESSSTEFPNGASRIPQFPKGLNRIPYDPGIWFNSAKFFDIEYQVYGMVLPNPPEHHASVYWEHPQGRSSIRIVYDKNTLAVLGFNLMGVRYRHEVCEKWIREETSVEEVLQNLGLANFDPEFYKEYEQEVVNLYNQQTGKSLRLKKRRGLAGVLKFFE